METLTRSFEPYRHFDPAGWLAISRQLTWWAGLLAVGVGGVMLLFGGRRLFRIVAMPLGAAIGLVWGEPLMARLGFTSSVTAVSTVTAMSTVSTVTVVGAVALAAAGLLLPHAVIFFAFAIPAGLMGGQLAGSADWLLGFGPGFLIGGAVGVVLHRPVAALLSSAVGAWLAVVGLVAALSPSFPNVAHVSDRPLLPLTLGVVLAAAGATFQLFIRPTEEEVRSRKSEKALAERRAKEAKAQEARWTKYTEKGS